MVAEADNDAVVREGAVSMFGALPIGLFRASRDGVLIEANNELAAIVGAGSAADLIGVDLDDFFVRSEELSDIVEVIGDDDSRLAGTELEIRRSDGSAAWVRANLRLVEVDGHEYLEGALDDVSEVHRARRDATESRVLLDAVNEAHLLFATGASPDELFSSLVQRLLDLTESTVGYVVARSDFSSSEPGNVLAATGLPESIALDRFTAELDGTRSPQDPIDMLGATDLEVPIRRGDDLVGLVGLGGRSAGYGIDVIVRLEPVLAACSTLIQAHRADSKRQTVEAELEYSETATRAMLETAASGIVTASADGTIRSFNPAAERLFGYDSDEVIGNNLTLLMVPPARDEHPEYLERYRTTRVRRVIGTGSDSMARHKDGSVFPVHLAVSEYRVQGNQFFAGVITDISEQKAAESELADARDAAERATQAKTSFLASMSHEIRTPMNGVLGMASMLEDTNLDHEQQQYLDIIKVSAEALLGIINDILDFSKVEAGHIELEQMIFEPRSLVRDCLALVAPQAEAKNLELVIDAPSELPAGLVGDAGRIRQILLNLLSNAVKFTETGTVTVEIGAEPNGPNVDFRLAVRDTGIGIAEEKLGTVFQSFAQADASTSRRYGGTGLGLAISKQLAGLMKGDIEIRSQIGVGSTFTFVASLPVASEAPQLEGESSVDSDLTPFDGSKLRILLAEDTITNQRVISAMLAKKGMRVEVAGNGLEAIEAVRSRPFDLVLMDVRMPEMDGIEATRRIRKLDIKQPKIVAMTADVIQETADLCFEAGMDAFLTKPVRVSEIIEVARGIEAARADSPRGPEPVEAEVRASVLKYSTLEAIGVALEVDDEELVASLVETYLIDLADGIDAIRAGFEEGNHENVQDPAHKLKSSSRFLGAMELGEMAEEVESIARNGYLPDEYLLGNLIEESRRVSEGMAKLLPFDVAI